ncbi:transposase domain-containing protein [Algoriphagus sp. C2-6-M1]|uniref:transposase domain-containing protein n=1 Tax=Algoriphagus persicinus TaxID=3108754 RepID=UPI002B3DA971|nr:transposase domain-containing protein [Algoriphagus sp. C2-6-M1]MEB2779903.1 transposase domain-containing protein [Algoriphagus sp. C2-6-M1]
MRSDPWQWEVKSFFPGSRQVAGMAAGMYSFMASCKKNKVNEFQWLKNVFERIQSHRQIDLCQLIPLA